MFLVGFCLRGWLISYVFLLKYCIGSDSSFENWDGQCFHLSYRSTISTTIQSATLPGKDLKRITADWMLTLRTACSIRIRKPHNSFTNHIHSNTHSETRWPLVAIETGFRILIKLPIRSVTRRAAQIALIRRWTQLKNTQIPAVITTPFFIGFISELSRPTHE